VGGTAVITVPYGLFRYHDHKHSIYLRHLVDLVTEHWELVELVLIDRYLGLSLRKPVEGAAREVEVPWREALALADRRVAAHDKTVDEQMREIERLRTEVEALRAEQAERRNLSAEVEAARERALTTAHDLEELGHVERRRRSELETLRLALASAEAERDEALRTADAVAEL
jgi:predicted RNase H-like nuclease (RuvC/YqgF family)